jgi:hypothetical protein
MWTLPQFVEKLLQRVRLQLSGGGRGEEKPARLLPPSCSEQLHYLPAVWHFQLLLKVLFYDSKCIVEHVECTKKRLKLKLEEAIEKDGVVVDPATHNDLETIIADNEAEVATKYPENSFQYIFWKQQQEAARMKKAEF